MLFCEIVWQVKNVKIVLRFGSTMPPSPLSCVKRHLGCEGGMHPYCPWGRPTPHRLLGPVPGRVGPAEETQTGGSPSLVPGSALLCFLLCGWDEHCPLPAPSTMAIPALELGPWAKTGSQDNPALLQVPALGILFTAMAKSLRQIDCFNSCDKGNMEVY